MWLTSIFHNLQFSSREFAVKHIKYLTYPPLIPLLDLTQPALDL